MKQKIKETVTGGGAVNYGDIFSRSIRIAWKHKILWIFGLLGSQSQGCNAPSFPSGGDGDAEDLRAFEELAGPEFSRIWAQYGQLIIIGILGLILVGLVFFILSIIFRGGLIYNVNRLDEGLTAGFGDGWRAGVRFFWRLLGLSLLFALVIILVLIPFILIIAGASMAVADAPILMFLVMLPFLLVLFVAILAGSIILELSQRELIVRDHRIIASLSEGWSLFRKNIGRSLVLWLIILGSTMVFFMGFVIALMILILPFVALGFMASATAAIIAGALLIIPLIILALGFFGTYTSAIWTVGYRQLTSLTAGSEAPLEPPAPEPGAGPTPAGGPA